MACVAVGSRSAATEETVATENAPFLVVLGIAQDGGYPQTGCRKSCCATVWENPRKKRHVSCVAVVDPQTSQRWIIDATPDFREQLRMLDRVFPVSDSPGITGIFLTHGHIGHYTGLVHLGREAMGTEEVPVFAMPRMHRFLVSHGPWDQLWSLRNISLRALKDGVAVKLSERVSITPFLVPHRDEYTETVGYRIDGPNRSAIYISDIDKWDRSDVSIVGLIKGVSVAYLDATFYSDGEIPGRSMADIPHPFIIESLSLFAALSELDRDKVNFIHLNHTNPALLPGSEARTHIEENGFNVAEEMDKFHL
jgi:pyrroloquinoline quinone biosynthesis protein B